MQRTLNRESKELEVVGREAIATCGERLSGRGLSFIGDTFISKGVKRGNLFNSFILTLPQLGNQAGIS